MSKGNKPFSHKTVSFFHNKASKTSPVLLAPPFLFTLYFLICYKTIQKFGKFDFADISKIQEINRLRLLP